MAVSAIYCALLATLVFRQRSAVDLSRQAVDPAGAIRIIFDAGAALLAFASLAAPRDGKRMRVAVLPKAYIGYVAVSCLGVLTAVSPSLVVFRVCELGTHLLVAGATARAFEHDFRRALEPVFRYVWLLVASLAAGLLFTPHLALEIPPGGILPFQLVGVMPAISSNFVGTIGLLLFVAGITAAPVRIIWISTGVSLVVLSQYRTGYVALTVVLLVLLAYKRRVSTIVPVLVAIVSVGFLATTGEVGVAWSRGQAPQEVAGLNSRRTFWEQGADVARRSPLIGTGLTSGTRYEVLADRLHRPDTSTIHSTWLEAYVGTGLLGTAFLIAAFAACARRAHLVARTGGDLLPIGLLTVLAVRSITGSTFELASEASILFLVLAFTLGIGTGTREDV